jgi:hypothetical protein
LEAERKAQEEAVRKAKEEAERKAKLKKIEVKVTDIRSYSSSKHKDCTRIWIDCKCNNLGTRVYDVELLMIDILTDIKYTTSRRFSYSDLYGGFAFFITNNTLPSKFKCQTIFRWKGNVIATSEFYDLDRREWIS